MSNDADPSLDQPAYAPPVSGGIKNGIYSSLVKAKKSFRPAIKNSLNPHFRTNYADLASCIDAVDDALVENGIFMYQEMFPDETGITIENIFIHESGESLRCGKLHVPASKQDAQGYGSALTYARRYAIMAACGIAPEDDDGNAAIKKPPQPKTITADNVLTLETMIFDVGVNKDAFLKHCKIERLEDLHADKYQVALALLEQKRKFKDG